MPKLFSIRTARRAPPLLLGLAALSLAAAPAGAQESAGLPAAIPDAADAFRKNVTLLGIPPATVAPDGLVFAAASWTDRRDGLHPQDDASVAAGFGMGLGEGLVDLQFTANITSLEDDFGDSGYLSVKASHRLAGAAVPTFVALGTDFLGAWGDAEDRDPGVTASLTMFPVLRLGAQAFPLMLTLGGGDAVSDFGEEEGLFAGIGIGLSESFGTSLAYNGDNFDFGGSLRLPGLRNWGLTAMMRDVFDEDDRQRVVVSVNWIAADVF
ncbi:hypothetical protein [Mangrovicoccus algicola]|uniref:Outer membrane protein beta-barrel domain-containing protein n=1 Tax=Mangrovicoccus algicola TaxID=2771008 RepID=A0A8J6Z6F1_9RHOB|nr:hypothetical protein [Mangrovicoccus algicola]MBE3637280.1 hypothetical protein [Mangrovicoccus algicola]